MLQFAQTLEATMVGVPERDVVLQGAVAAERFVASTHKVQVMLKLQTKVDLCTLSCKQRDGRHETFRSVDVVESSAGV